jgi:conjugative transfer pilus assembly protein TraH
MKTVKTKVKAVTLAIALMATSGAHSADWIQDFYTTAGAAVNVTSGQAVSSQSVVGYSGGGVAWRIPTKTIQPMTVDIPSIRAGCGGIDVHLGGWSFVNKNEFVTALRNFGQASVGYFFQLALKSISPEISAALDTINYYANQINQFSMNSCAAGKAAAQGAWDALNTATNKEGETIARARGDAVDEIDAKLSFMGSGNPFTEAIKKKYLQYYGQAWDATNKPSRSTLDGKPVVGEYNLVWELLKRSNGAAGISDDEIQLVMSLVGTSIMTAAPTSDASDTSMTPVPKPSTVEFADIVGFDNVGGATTTTRTYVCDDPRMCLNPVSTAGVTLSFKGAANLAVIDLRQAIQNRTNVNSALAIPRVNTVLKLSSVPLARAAAMAETAGLAGAVAGTMLDDLVEYAALDAGVNLVRYYLGILERASTQGDYLPAPAISQLQAMQERMRTIRENMNQQVVELYKKKGDPFVKIDQLNKLEQAMYSNMNINLASNARFGKRQ